MQGNTIFVDGMRIYSPHEKSPDFVRGAIVVDLNQFVEWAQKYCDQDNKLKIDILKSKKGSLYLKLNTFNNHKEPAVNTEPVKDVRPSDDLSQIPF